MLCAIHSVRSPLALVNILCEAEKAINVFPLFTDINQQRQLWTKDIHKEVYLPGTRMILRSSHKVSVCIYQNNLHLISALDSCGVITNSLHISWQFTLGTDCANRWKSAQYLHAGEKNCNDFNLSGNWYTTHWYAPLLYSSFTLKNI